MEILFNILRNGQTVFRSGCIILHSYQKCMRVTVPPHSHQYLLLLHFLLKLILQCCSFYNFKVFPESFSLTLSLLNVIKSIGKLKMLVYLDMSKNRIETVDMDISGCEALEDLLLSSNMLQQLPDSIGENIIFCYQCLCQIYCFHSQQYSLFADVGNILLA